MPQGPQSQLARTQSSVVNESTELTDAEVIPVIAAPHQQVTNDLGLPPSPQMVYQSGRYSI